MRNYISPLTITASGSVSNSGTGNAVFGPLGTQSWTVDNLGNVTATGNFNGLDLEAAACVSNSGRIAGGDDGVYIYGLGTVVNSGRIAFRQMRIARAEEAPVCRLRLEARWEDAEGGRSGDPANHLGRWSLLVTY